jgi:hypothetical protein
MTLELGDAADDRKNEAAGVVMSTHGSARDLNLAPLAPRVAWVDSSSIVDRTKRSR